MQILRKFMQSSHLNILKSFQETPIGFNSVSIFEILINVAQIHATQENTHFDILTSQYILFWDTTITILFNLTGQPNDRRSTRSSKHDGRPVKCPACSGLRPVGRQPALSVSGPSPCLRPGFANFCSVRGPCCCDALGYGSRRPSRTRSDAQPAGSRVCPSCGTGRCSRRGWQSLFRLFIDQC